MQSTKKYTVTKILGVRVRFLIVLIYSHESEEGAELAMVPSFLPYRISGAPPTSDGDKSEVQLSRIIIIQPSTTLNETP